MKRVYIALAVAVLIAGGLIAAGAHAAYKGHHGQFLFDRGMGRLTRKLDLTDAQREQIKSMAKAEWPTVKPSLQKLADGQKQMFAATQNGAYDEAKVRTIAEEQSQTIADLLVEKERFISQVYANVLTPEQRTKADAMRQKWSQHLQKFLQEQSSAPQGAN
jgi:Spy/CpxP family protein refolding chaperone